MIKHIENNKLEEEYKNGLAIIDFYAEWCGPCKMIGPILEEISKEGDSIKIYKIDIDNNEELAREFGVMAVPTLFYFKDGKQKDRTLGFMPKSEIIKIIEKSNK